MNPIKARYEARIREIYEARDKAVSNAPAQYRASLKTLEKRFIDSGDLKSVLTVRNEIKRFEKAGVVTTNDCVADPEALRLAQTALIEASNTAERARTTASDNLNVQYLVALEQLKVDLTKRARIDEAIAVNAETERVRPMVPAELLKAGIPSPENKPSPAIPKLETPSQANPVQPAKNAGSISRTTLETLLRSNRWIFYYLGPSKPGSKKEMTFLRNGLIGIGDNENEHAWALSDSGELEISNSAGKVLCRLTYDADKKLWYTSENKKGVLTTHMRHLVLPGSVK